MGIGTVVGAILLLGSIGIFKTLATSVDEQDSVPTPSIGKALTIGFVVSLLNLAFVYLVLYITDYSRGSSWAKAIQIAQARVYPVSFIIFVWLLKVKLPTTVGRAIKVSLIYFVLTIFLSIVLFPVISASVIFITGSL